MTSGISALLTFQASWTVIGSTIANFAERSIFKQHEPANP